MAGYDPHDIQSILRFARGFTGKRLADIAEDIDPTAISSKRTKGFVGHAYEAAFGLARNSLSAPDFTLAGVELKIVPMIGAPSARRVKERMSITMINYHDIASIPWPRSHLESKTRQILMIFYDWVRGKPMASFKTLLAHLWERDEFDALLLGDAYRYVTAKVLAGEAHTISEGDTKGVGAATKGAGGKWVSQPYSDIEARPRAFAFKPPFTEAIWLDARDRLETVDPDPDAVSTEDFEEQLRARLEPYRGMTVAQIAKQLGIPRSNAKNWLSTVSRRMMGAPEGKRDVAELVKAGITMRTVRINESGRPHEDVSFPKIDYLALAEETWESASLREHLNHLFFVVFRHRRNDDLLRARFETSFFWRPDGTELATIEQEWRTFRSLITSGGIRDKPQGSETNILHIRPHGRDSTDVAELPNGTSWVKSSFWLNKAFVQGLVEQA